MKYLIFGGSGFIGSNLLEELAQEGEEAVVFDAQPDPDGLAAGRNVKVVKGDIANFYDVVTAIADHRPDYVVDLVSVMSSAPKVNDENNHPWPAIEAHSKGLYNILEAARIVPIKRTIWASSVAVYGASNSPTPWNEDSMSAPDTVYGIAKRLDEFMGEYYFARYKIDSVGLRFTFVYGPRMFRVRSAGRKSSAYAFIEELFTKGLTQDKVTVFGLKRTQDWLFARDAARSIILAARSKTLTKRYYQMSGSRRQAGQMVEAAQKMLPNLRIEILDKENELAGRMGGANYDYSSAKRDFGYEPKYSVEEGIRLTMEYYKNRK